MLVWLRAWRQSVGPNKACGGAASSGEAPPDAEAEGNGAPGITLGSGLIQTQNAMMAARTTADKKLRASLS
jgi:hypothetical protein